MHAMLTLKNIYIHVMHTYSDGDEACYRYRIQWVECNVAQQERQYVQLRHLTEQPKHSIVKQTFGPH